MSLSVLADELNPSRQTIVKLVRHRKNKISSTRKRDVSDDDENVICDII